MEKAKRILGTILILPFMLAMLAIVIVFGSTTIITVLLLRWLFDGELPEIIMMSVAIISMILHIYLLSVFIPMGCSNDIQFLCSLL